MSRTDVHAPWHVTGKDPYFQARPWYRLCGCKMCTGQLNRKRNARVARMRQRSLLSELRKLSRQDIEEIPTFIPWGNTW
jgi:hypothetical protein